MREQSFGRGRGGGHGRGRRRIERVVQPGARFWCFAPLCGDGDDKGSVTFHPYEIELLRLIDLVGLNQEEAAAILGVSRKTVWRDLHGARRKLTDALVNGRTIEVTGCPLKTEEKCNLITDREDNAASP